jgi:GNAT superfamily N-acetyltransferase
VIRAAVAGDGEAIFALARPFATTFTVDARAFADSFAELLATPHAHLLVAARGDRLVGYLLGFEHVTFYANGRVAWVEELMVSAAHQRQGIGRALLRRFEQLVAARGVRLVALATRRAAPFYTALGYEESAAYYRRLLTRDEEHEHEA